MNNWKKENKDLAEDLMSIIDDLRRVLRSNPWDATTEGITIIHSNLIKTLEKRGFFQIKSFGKTFNPAIHHAISLKTAYDFPENIILEVIEDGYMFDGKLFKAAKVVVSKKIDKKF